MSAAHCFLSPAELWPSPPSPCPSTRHAPLVTGEAVLDAVESYSNLSEGVKHLMPLHRMHH